MNALNLKQAVQVASVFTKVNPKDPDSMSTDKYNKMMFIPTEQDKPDYKLTSFTELMNERDNSQWLIKDYFQQKTLNMLFGDPSTTKSFLAMDLSFCIASGIDWNGNKTKNGKVVYVAGEGQNNLSFRFSALKERYQHDPEDLYILKSPVDLMDQNSIKSLKNAIDATCKNPILIVIDTLNRNIGSGNEDSAQDFAIVLQNLDKYIIPHGASILFIHHPGHAHKERGRGSTAINGSHDTMYRITKKDNVVTMECTKAKDHEEPEPISFNIVKQATGFVDEDGEPAISIILESTEYRKPVTTCKLSSREQMLLDKLKDLIRESGELVPDGKNDQRCILKSKWRRACYKSLKEETDSDKQSTIQAAFRRGSDKLEHLGLIAILEVDYVYISQKATSL